MLRFNIVSGDLTWNDEKKARLNRSESLIFAYLLKNVNHFSSKDDLLSAGWPGKFISPNSLAVAIKNIRQALSNAAPDFSIETVHRRGYILHGNAIGFKIIDNLAFESQSASQDEQDECHPSTLDSLKKNDDDLSIEEKQKATLLTANHLPVTRKLYIRAKGLLFFVYIILILYLSFVFFTYTGDLYCYQLNSSTRACGVFYLNEKQQNSLKHLLKDEKGDFFYGHENYSHDLKIYKSN
ncbi:winged helix-turn-helix domain-containing protein [Aeromonas veronii]|uniref:winged helix-turn-helix domain-containing protein n=1 Tax=Aeromonas veronii TaxID=654 RepID=UPI003BA36FA7